ncbi:MAG: hypothetical protein IPG83_02020 [Novosphingobium sp.]|nr:hypothetical protein [Novosphingobium sp.]
MVDEVEGDGRRRAGNRIVRHLGRRAASTPLAGRRCPLIDLRRSRAHPGRDGAGAFLFCQTRSRLYQSFTLTLPEPLHVRRINRLVRTQAQSAAQQADDAAITEFEGVRQEPEVPTVLLVDSDEERPERVRQARTRPFRSRPP